MFRHVVLMSWTEGTTPADVTAIAEALGGLPAAIAELRDYRFGHDVGINEGNFDFAVVADFEDADDYVVYRDHPLHRAIIAERIAPHLAARASVQYDVS
jgi:Stress responsive A/B Barrel Domain